MSGSSLLSVIIPCYQVAETLPATVASLRADAGPDVELVFVDDGSIDATAARLAEAEASLPGVRVVTSPVNRGLSVARNLGLDASSGAYVTFLDAGDLVRPGHLHDLLGCIRRLGCDVVRTDHLQVVGRRRQVQRISHGPRGVVLDSRDAILPADRATSVDAPYAWAGIYHRRLADDGTLRFSERLRTCEDRPWIWRLHLRPTSFAVVGLTGVLYRRDGTDSLSRRADASQVDFITAYDQIVAAVLADREAERFLPKAVRAYATMVCHHLSREDYPPLLTERLAVLSAAALARLPQPALDAAVASLDPARRAQLADLRAAA